MIDQKEGDHPPLQNADNWEYVDPIVDESRFKDEFDQEFLKTETWKQLLRHHPRTYEEHYKKLEEKICQRGTYTVGYWCVPLAGDTSPSTKHAFKTMIKVSRSYIYKACLKTRLNGCASCKKNPTLSWTKSAIPCKENVKTLFSTI